MTVPCLLKLFSTPDGYRVTRTPIPALDELHTGAPIGVSIARCTEAKLELLAQGDLRLNVSCDAPVHVRVGSGSFVYDPATGEYVFDGGKRYVTQRKGVLSLRILTDTASCEFFLQDEISASYGQEMAGKALELGCEAGLAADGIAWTMKSIWNGYEDQNLSEGV